MLTHRKDERRQKSVIYGAASDSLTLRFCRIDNEGNWSQRRLMEWEKWDKGRIYSLFRSSIRIAALSSPSTSPIKNLEHREKFLAPFANSERIRKFEYATIDGLGAISLSHRACHFYPSPQSQTGGPRPTKPWWKFHPSPGIFPLI